MQQIEIVIPLSDPVEFFGAGNARYRTIKKAFPKLKLMQRGNLLKAEGPEDELERFEETVNNIFQFIEIYNTISNPQLDRILRGHYEPERSTRSDGVLVHGPAGIQVKARTPNQRKMVDAMRENDMLFAIGPAGTGKSYTAVALAVQALKEKRVKRIILTRPAVEAGENLGFLPGDLKEKLDPYMQPLYDALMDMLHFDKLADYMEKGVIEIAPLAFMRGRTLDKAFVILDEAQNATLQQMKMFLTRMGADAKFIITGDASQVDLPKKQQSGLMRTVEMLNGTEGLSVVKLDGKDVIRHPLVRKIIRVFEDAGE
ncbi:MAG: PhoH family protein [Flavobacteriales bacterium]